MRKESIKKRALKHVKRGLHHLNINYSLSTKNISREVRRTIKNKKYFSEKDLYELLIKKVRKGVSSKWKGSVKWHKECNRILPLLKININKMVVIDEGWMFNIASKKSTISNAVEIVQHELNRIKGNNNMNVADIEKILEKVVDEKIIRLEVRNGMKLFATTNQPGEITFIVKVTEKSTEEYEIIHASIIIEMLHPM
ncbi:hypothetical protein OD350_28820 (plasmid) [Clostridium beijerinckii]|uniref:hypothetical protein n=1 Tax=Clostridium beijerinckii TaxID=1520 RepID=UPI002226D397|nr:hypothetical protein [Clostridium beijerinckii]UYZ39078.1 hypothetical protein OD350_28820 [Clostridium beijerinckii]